MWKGCPCVQPNHIPCVHCCLHFKCWYPMFPTGNPNHRLWGSSRKDRYPDFQSLHWPFSYTTDTRRVHIHIVLPFVSGQRCEMTYSFVDNHIPNMSPTELWQKIGGGIKHCLSRILLVTRDFAFLCSPWTLHIPFLSHNLSGRSTRAYLGDQMDATLQCQWVNSWIYFRTILHEHSTLLEISKPGLIWGWGCSWADVSPAQK